MKVKQKPSLQELNTFGVPAKAKLLFEIENEEDVLQLLQFDRSHDFVLGGGSNVLFVNDVPGMVYLNRITGIDVIEEDSEHALIEAGAGEIWHELVTWSLGRGLSGLENMALIPGLAGAAPIQNIGAYGAELSSVLDSVTAWDWQAAKWVVIGNADCSFGYRDSRFKSAEPGRYFITSIRLRLRKHFVAQLSYPGLRGALDAAGISEPSAADVCAAVIRLRREKLPDPALQGNAGSFFKNPVVAADRLEELRTAFPKLPVWPLDDRHAKISAAWMIEQCGLKGLQMDGAAVSERHALVLINLGNATGHAIWQLALHVQREVQQKFGIALEPEPEIYTGPIPNATA